MKKYKQSYFSENGYYMPFKGKVYTIHQIASWICEEQREVAQDWGSYWEAGNKIRGTKEECVKSIKQFSRLYVEIVSEMLPCRHYATFQRADSLNDHLWLCINGADW